MNFKYLIKRAQLGYQGLKDVIVINNHEKKSERVKEEELNRYRRFFGAKINFSYSELSFEQFADDPSVIDSL